MKKLIIGIASLFVASGLFAASGSTTVLLAGSGVTNVPVVINGSLLLNQITLSASSNISTLRFYDSPTTLTTYTTSAYTNMSSYATNYVFLYTNYYGVTNTYTNLVLVDVTNTVAAATNSYPNRLAIGATTNSTVFNGSWYFTTGLMITNTSTNTALISLQYLQ